MKKFKLFVCTFVLAGAALVSSCSSDDSSGTAPSIEGKWSYNKTITSVNDGAPTSTNYPNHEANCEKDYQEFAVGGIFKDVVWNKNSQNQCVIDDSDVSTWSKADNVLTIDGETYTITKLTHSELRYESTTTTGGATLKVTQVFTKG
jgi:alpha-mannosidase